MNRFWVRRHVAAGWGGLAAVSEITGLARSTIGRGLKDLDAAPLPKGRVRRKGGGRRVRERRGTDLRGDAVFRTLASMGTTHFTHQLAIVTRYAAKIAIRRQDQEKAPMMPVRSSAWSALLLLANIAMAFGQQVGTPAAGKQLAETICLGCHGAQNKAPAFSAIAAMPSTTVQSLDVFLRTSHPTMPNLILSDTDRGDLIAYILSLR